jgi:cysteine desulfurase
MHALHAEGAGHAAWAHPSSVHRAGRASRAQLESARTAIAAALGASASDVVLTSGGSEACNLAVHGVLAQAEAGGHVITSAIEHPAVARPLEALAAARGLELTRLGVDHGRAPLANTLAGMLTSRTRLVALQWVNHETGTRLPVDEYARVCRAVGVPLFIDASQALGKLPIDVEALGADLLACAAHKIGGPAGAGALWVRRGIDIEPLILGGAQERGRRAGTPDVVAQTGFAAACGLIGERLAAQPRIAALRDRLERALLERSPVVVRNATDGPRVATVSSLSVRGWRGDALVAALDVEGVAASSGAACSSGRSEPSGVLRAMHPDESWRSSSALRLSFGPQTSEIDADSALAVIGRVLARPPA